MAKQRSRLWTKSLITMSAAASLTVAMSTPARAETINLICNFQSPVTYQHVEIDTDRNSVVNTVEDEDRRWGPYDATISDTFVRWTEHNKADWERQYTIDRVSGTIKGIMFYRGEQRGDMHGQCRRATQKF